MNILDNLEKIKKLDSKNVIGSVRFLAAQIDQAWNEVNKINFPKKYYQIKKIVFSGMGGSALGAYVIKSLYQNELTIPLEIVNGYHLPGYTDPDTLVVLSTYSGTTEETLSCAIEAQKKKALITGITTGKNLAEFLVKNKYPSYIYEPKNNPSSQPRLGTGYSITAFLAILNKLKFLNLKDSEIEKTVSYIKDEGIKYNLEIKTHLNPLKKMAQNLYQKTPVIVSAEHLTNTGRILRNQFHETAKSFASFYDLPEMNHHLLESLTNPLELKNLVKFIMIESDLYSKRINQRIEITKEVILKNGYEYYSYKPQSRDKLTQCFEVVNYGNYLTFYLAMLNNIDPSKIPWVDFFKNELIKKD